MSTWFAEIGQWRRFCERPTSALVDDSEFVSEEAYMEWYSEIAKTRVGKPQPEPLPRYTSRELFPNMEAYNLVSILITYSRLPSKNGYI